MIVLGKVFGFHKAMAGLGLCFRSLVPPCPSQNTAALVQVHYHFFPPGQTCSSLLPCPVLLCPALCFRPPWLTLAGFLKACELEQKIGLSSTSAGRNRLLGGAEPAPASPAESPGTRAELLSGGRAEHPLMPRHLLPSSSLLQHGGGSQLLPEEQGPVPGTDLREERLLCGQGGGYGCVYPYFS